MGLTISSIGRLVLLMIGNIAHQFIIRELQCRKCRNSSTGIFGYLQRRSGSIFFTAEIFAADNIFITDCINFYNVVAGLICRIGFRNNAVFYFKTVVFIVFICRRQVCSHKSCVCSFGRNNDRYFSGRNIGFTVTV